MAKNVCQPNHARPHELTWWKFKIWIILIKYERYQIRFSQTAFLLGSENESLTKKTKQNKKT